MTPTQVSDSRDNCENTTIASLDWYREDLFLAYADDHSEEGMWLYADAYQHPVKACNWPQQVYEPRPNCNDFHEISLKKELLLGAKNDVGGGGRKEMEEESTPSSSAKFLGHGYYRDAWLVPDHPVDFVVKQTRFKHHQNRNRVQKVQTEAIILDMLTHSPLVSDIYGHCAFSVAVQAGAYDMESSVLPLHPEYQQKRPGHLSQEQLDQLSVDDAVSLNNFTVEEKLDIVLQMTESLAEAHGLPTGPVVSGDVSVDQWLRSSDDDDDEMHLLLNDFDNAVFLSYNQTAQQYCKYESGSVGGFKTPEEHHRSHLDESVDMWKVGSLIFTVLTGLKPYYASPDEETTWALLDAGTPPYLDPRYATRSLIEGRLVEIMRRCHVRNPAERATIFEVVAHLRETKRLHERRRNISRSEGTIGCDDKRGRMQVNFGIVADKHGLDLYEACR